MNHIIKNPATRAWLYGIAAAAVPLLVAYGLITAEQSGVWLALVGAILGVGTNVLALANTPKRASNAD